ncbi:MAG: hypothetical protein ACYCZB_05295 [Acidiphilium sp.]
MMKKTIAAIAAVFVLGTGVSLAAGYNHSVTQLGERHHNYFTTSSPTTTDLHGRQPLHAGQKAGFAHNT